MSKIQNPIDAFILAALEKRGLAPAPPADRRTLIRRAAFDLLGVPPPPEEVEAFVQDRSPNAYEKLIDRLLADPRYGERWGRHWLDVARFGESQGFERDVIRDHAWRYRDYVIQSFNADKPYTQFIREQIAGDALPVATRDSVIATGFLVAGPWDEVANTVTTAPSVRLRAREEEMEDIIGTVAQTFLGVTANCARCHDHKFDPIPQRDYYRLKAALEGVRPGDRPILTPQEMRAHEEEVAQIRQRLDEQERGLFAIEKAGRERALQVRGQAVTGAPLPIARWTFETDARDLVGDLHGRLVGGAMVANGRLRLNGTGAFVQTAPISRAIREKTLEAWVSLPNLAQRGGGVLSLQTPDGRRFDGIVFGERAPGRWIAGSELFHRTQDLNAPAETAKLGELVHLAIVYRADNRITVYRNGAPHAAYAPSGPDAALPTYPANGAQVLIGLRHTGAGNGFLAGEIEEARLYDRALSAAEVAASFQAGVSNVTQEEIIHAQTQEEHLQWEQRHRTVAELQDALKIVEPLPLAYAANPQQPPEPTHILLRGDPEKPGAVVAAGGLSAVQSLAPDFGLAPDAPEGLRRLQLADWIADAKNPLTARVMVNRVWHYHFGRGLVGTPNDFGINGERPSHPELLDWLAAAFMEKGRRGEREKGSRDFVSPSPLLPFSPSDYSCAWRLKPLHRLILLSNTYRQSAQFNPKAAAIDADNRLLWRFAPHRLEGEAVRDAMLCVSGQINRQMGGPSFRPFTVTINNSHFYTLTDPTVSEYNRRTVYRIGVHSAKSPLLETLDCPDPSTKTPKRSITTTALQALELMNNSFVLRQARHFAARVQQEAGPDPKAQVSRAYRLAFGRPPTAPETARAAALAREHGMESLCWALLNANEFLYVK